MNNLIEPLKLSKNEDLIFLKEGYYRGFVMGALAAQSDLLAYILRKYGEYNHDEFMAFIREPLMKPQYQYFYNEVSHMKAGFVGRIN